MLASELMAWQLGSPWGKVQWQAKFLLPKVKKRVYRIGQIRALDTYGSDSAQKKHLLVNAKNSDDDIARVGVCHHDHDIKRQ
jgi:hypothetical protein